MPATASQGVAAAAKRVDAVADSLAALGEETKRIAIAAALSASGGAEGDAIKVADEIRTIATRFNAVAQQWKEASPAIRSAIDTIATSAVGAEKRRAAAVKALEGVVSKTRRGAAFGGTGRGGQRSRPRQRRKSKPARRRARRQRPSLPLPERIGAAGESRRRRRSDGTARAQAAAEPEADDDFVTQRAANGPGTPAKKIRASPTSPASRRTNLFMDASGLRPTITHGQTTLCRRARGGRQVDLTRGTQAAETAGAVDASHAPTPKKAGPAPAPAAHDDGFLRGPGGREEPPAASQPRQTGLPSRRIKVDDIAVAPPRPVDHDPDAIDLYALGRLTSSPACTPRNDTPRSPHNEWIVAHSLPAKFARSAKRSASFWLVRPAVSSPSRRSNAARSVFACSRGPCSWSTWRTGRASWVRSKRCSA